MDKLGTYALVAALKEISERKNAAEKKPLGVAQNERWISLRSCAREMPQTLLEPPAEPRYEDLRSAPSSASDAGGQLDRHSFAQQRLAQSFQAAQSQAPAESLRPTLSTLNKQGNFSSIRQIEMRHMAARRSVAGEQAGNPGNKHF